MPLLPAGFDPLKALPVDSAAPAGCPTAEQKSQFPLVIGLESAALKYAVCDSSSLANGPPVPQVTAFARRRSRFYLRPSLSRQYLFRQPR
jgi:hypothetical protein